MASSKATTVSEYLDELPADKKNEISKVRSAVRKNLPKGYKEAMDWGMITWQIPMSRYSRTYNNRPLYVAGLAAQKNYIALYLVGPYAEPDQLKTLQKGFEKAGKKLDMGKSCVRFKKADDLPLDVIGEVIAATPPEKLIELNERLHPEKPKKRG